jgi:hypothetical protein
MTVNLSLLAGAGAQFFDDSGAPLSGGLLYTYAAGTTTPAATYTSNTGLTANSNPIVLDAAGRVAEEIWLTTGSTYKFVLKNFTFVQIWSKDNIPGANDPTTLNTFIADLANSSDPAKGDALVGFRQSNASGNMTGSVGSTVHKKLQEFISVKDFGAVGDTTTDDTAAIQAAIDALISNQYESANGLYFPAGIYKITDTLTITLAESSISFYCDSKATINVQVNDGDYGITVDYSTGATANFPTFNMTNIALSDISAGATKNGIQTSRVIGSKFTQCEFNYLNVAVNMLDDSNINTFDTCMWRGNVNGWKSTDGIANNNVFLNCQWRYHSGTAFDATGTDGNTIIGGDFEPDNASPVVIASSLTMQNVRFERNDVNANTGIQVLNNNTLDVSCFCDGGTQVLPLFNVVGSNNKLHCKGTGAQAVYLTSTAYNNETEIDYFSSLVSSGSLIYDSANSDGSNVLKTKGSIQGIGDSPFPEGAADVVLPQDLTTWTKNNCTVTAISGGYEMVGTGATPSISYTLTGTYTNLYVSLTNLPVNPSGQISISFNGGTARNLSAAGIQKRVVATSFYTDTFVNPTITLTMTVGTVGSAVDIYNVRSAQSRVPN